jgi:hypothetical protein
MTANLRVFSAFFYLFATKFVLCYVWREMGGHATFRQVVIGHPHSAVDYIPLVNRAFHKGICGVSWRSKLHLDRSRLPMKRDKVGQLRYTKYGASFAPVTRRLIQQMGWQASGHPHSSVDS